MARYRSKTKGNRARTSSRAHRCRSCPNGSRRRRSRSTGAASGNRWADRTYAGPPSRPASRTTKTSGSARCLYAERRPLGRPCSRPPPKAPSGCARPTRRHSQTTGASPANCNSGTTGRARALLTPNSTGSGRRRSAPSRNPPPKACTTTTRFVSQHVACSITSSSGRWRSASRTTHRMRVAVHCCHPARPGDERLASRSFVKRLPADHRFGMSAQSTQSWGARECISDLDSIVTSVHDAEIGRPSLADQERAAEIPDIMHGVASVRGEARATARNAICPPKLGDEFTVRRTAIEIRDIWQSSGLDTTGPVFDEAIAQAKADFHDAIPLDEFTALYNEVRKRHDDGSWAVAGQ